MVHFIFCQLYELHKEMEIFWDKSTADVTKNTLYWTDISTKSITVTGTCSPRTKYTNLGKLAQMSCWEISFEAYGLRAKQNIWQH